MAMTFKGGVHPYDGKSLSSSKPIRYLKDPGEESIVFLSQHIGAPATPLVQEGDHVKRGQLIGEASGFISANVHAPVSGVVKKIEMRGHVSGAPRQAIVIENDGLYEEVEYTEIPMDELTPEQIIDRVKAGGVIGEGGATFPTHVKLMVKDPNAIDYVLVNAAECEPYLTCDHRFMLENSEDLINGLKVILKVFPNAQGHICIEDNKPECIQKLSGLVQGEPRIHVTPCKTKYPQGAERTLINVVAKRELPGTKLPADVGCVVDNVETVIDVYKAAVLGIPNIDEVMTITGDAIADPGNIIVPLGTKLDIVLNEFGGFPEDAEKIIAGGPMMGPAMYNFDVYTSKGFKAILALKNDEVSKLVESPCINCGRCVAACPIRLMPTKLEKAALSNDIEKFEEYFGTECIQCGSCSFICPAKRNLATNIRAMRNTVIAYRRKK